MDRKILIVTIVILAAAILVTPVMAIGPFNALDVGNNKNLGSSGAGVMNHRGGEGGGLIYWMMGVSGEHWVKWEFQDAASQAKGIMKNAIIAEYSGPQNGMMPYFVSLGENENKWIYLSGDGDYPSQYNGGILGTHGMLWWFMFGVTFVATYPVVFAEKYAEVYAATPGTPEEKDAAATAAATPFAMAAARNAGIAAGNADVAEHSAGVFWKTNEIKGSLP
jgi:hypothetical protein